MVLPPLHPILVNFTAALVPASFISDALGRALRRPSLTSAAWWMLFYAAAITPFTALAGWLWLGQMNGVDMSEMSIHKWLGMGLAIALAGLVLWRWRSYRRGMAPGVAYLVIASVTVAALVVQGHLGGQMSFGGDSQDSNSPTSPSDARERRGEIQWRDHIDIKPGT